VPSTSKRAGIRAKRAELLNGHDGTGASARACRVDARTLAQDAQDLVIVREDLARLMSKGCPRALTGRALALGLAPAQRRAFVADLPTAMGRQVRAALDSAAG
jgi:hypothetical protein